MNSFLLNFLNSLKYDIAEGEELISKIISSDRDLFGTRFIVRSSRFGAIKSSLMQDKITAPYVEYILLFSKRFKVILEFTIPIISLSSGRPQRSFILVKYGTLTGQNISFLRSFFLTSLTSRTIPNSKLVRFFNIAPFSYLTELEIPLRSSSIPILTTNKEVLIPFDSSELDDEVYSDLLSEANLLKPIFRLFLGSIREDALLHKKNHTLVKDSYLKATETGLSFRLRRVFSSLQYQFSILEETLTNASELEEHISEAESTPEEEPSEEDLKESTSEISSEEEEKEAAKFVSGGKISPSDSLDSFVFKSEILPNKYLKFVKDGTNRYKIEGIENLISIQTSEGTMKNTSSDFNSIYFKALSGLQNLRGDPKSFIENLIKSKSSKENTYENIYVDSNALNTVVVKFLSSKGLETVSSIYPISDEEFAKVNLDQLIMIIEILKGGL
jgi:hypothetical protein